MERIYIMHALVGDGSRNWGNRNRNIERYLRFAAMATNQGAVVISWVHHSLMHERKLTQGTPIFYLERDRELLKVSTRAWLCSPPEVSSGIRFELDVCKEFNIPVIQGPRWLDPDYYPTGQEP